MKTLAMCEAGGGRGCEVGPSPGLVFSGQPFDMWQESWRHFGMRHRRTVIVHRECNPRADHSRDGR